MEFDIETTLEKLQKAWKDDLPETQRSIFDETAKELLRTRDYHHLCELMTYCLANFMRPLFNHILTFAEEVITVAEQDGNKMMTALFHLIAGKTIEMEQHGSISPNEHYQMALADPDYLASIHLNDYSWLTKGHDSNLFGNDLLSFIGIEIGSYSVLYDYYKKTGNRAATCYSQIQMIINEDSMDDDYEDEDDVKEDTTNKEIYDKLISVIDEFGDLPVVCLAVKYIVENNLIPKPDDNGEDAENKYIEQKYLYAKSFADRFADDEHAIELVSILKEMERPRFSTSYFDETAVPDKPFTIDVSIKNISRLTISVYPTDLTSEDVLRYDKRDLRKNKKHVSSSPIYSKSYRYKVDKPYITTEAQIEVEGLPLGIYFVELTSNKGISDSILLYVSGITAIVECLPEKQMRIVVVDNTTGQPVRKAMVNTLNWSNDVTKTLFCDINGEVVFQYRHKPYGVLPYTKRDKYCNVIDTGYMGEYDYDKEKDKDITEILTDRTIYRPGQTIHAAFVQYHVDKNKLVKTVCQKSYVEFSKQYGKHLKIEGFQTDELGVAHCDFVIPEDIETGDYTLSCDGGRKTIKIEEYKRPTFEVKIDDYGKPYKDGDTIELEGIASTYAGVPVENGRVKYRVKRAMAWWWYFLIPYWERSIWYERHSNHEYFEGESVTDETGRFVIKVPMKLHFSSRKKDISGGVFMNIIVEADVVDSTGEMQTGRMTLPLSDKKHFMHIQMDEKKELSDSISFVFVAKNATGQDIDAEFQYWMDDSKKIITASSNQAVTLPPLEAGEHVLHVKRDTEEFTHDFVVFDKDGVSTPSTTEKWSYQSAEVFPENGDDVILQIGCSEENTYILYNLFSGNTLLESGAEYAKSGMINRRFSYKEEYGNALLVSYAWVRDKKLQTQNFTITKPIPKRELHLSWKTFRDRVIPGTKEKWVLSVKDSDGNNVTANVIATLYDKSLDQLSPNRWNGFGPVLSWNVPSAKWYFCIEKASLSDCMDPKSITSPYVFNSFKHKISQILFESMCFSLAAPAGAPPCGSMCDDDGYTGSAEMEPPVIDKEDETQELHLRSDMSETAFFMPMLRTNSDGEVVMEFTLPDSLTTWKLQAVAHTSEMYFSYIEDETVARKQVMVQPNMPRFVRVGDNTTISTKVTNCSGKAITGKVVFELLNVSDEQVFFSESRPFTMDGNATLSESFHFTPDEEMKDYICRVFAIGEGFSDGEQHSLQVLPNKTEVTVTHVISQDGAGTTSIDTAAMLPVGSTRRRLSLQYTNNPIWLAIHALPAMTDPYSNNAISVSVSLYCTLLTAHLQNAVKEYGEGLVSNPEDMDRLTKKLVGKLQKLQGHGGGFKWYRDMPESFYMTTEVLMHLCRLQKFIGGLEKVEGIVRKAFLFCDQEMCSQVSDMQKREKEGKKVFFPTFSMLQHMYSCAISGRFPVGEAKKAYDYLLSLLMKDIHRQTIREKAMTSVILEHSGFHDRAKVYAESLRQYTKCDDERGRTFDTPRATYSWYSYKIPTHVAGMEALYMLCPEDKTTYREMQKWLLQEKRTQMWETPIDSVNSVHALLLEADEYLTDNRQAEFHADGKKLNVVSRGDEGYVETPLDSSTQTLSVTKHSKGLSWGAVFAQFLQPMSDVAASGSGMTIKREIITDKKQLHVGDRIRVRLTYTCERNFDLVTVIDSKAACMEPIEQLSWSDSFKHVSPRDTETRYSYYGLGEGTHSIETEYYLDRPGVYEMGVATIVCTYAPEFQATCPSQKLYVEK